MPASAGFTVIPRKGMPSIVKDKSFVFAVHVVFTCKVLRGQHEYIMSKQLLRSGTAIGALVREAQHAESRADFVHKMSVALKEANETAYWIELLLATRYLDPTTARDLQTEIAQLLKLLTRIVKTTKEASRR